ncbi:MAG: hypothetical protein HY765_02300 [Rhodomicrobium sp.]|nr:hypothetical protein [Rhodomicrobium sp.]
MGALLTIGAWFVRRIAAWGLGTAATLAFLSPAGPILTGIANAIGAIITAIFEIIVSLSKSAEGRVALSLAAAALGFLYLRFHYIEEGKAEARAKFTALHKPCAMQKVAGRKR